MKKASIEYAAVSHLAGKGRGRGQFAETLRGIAIDADDHVYAVGDSKLEVFSRDGEPVRSWATSRPGYCVAVDRAGRVWIGQSEQVEVFSADGDRLDTRRDPGRLGLITAIGFGGGDVFLADAQARCIHRYDLKGGFLNDIGDQHRKGGFHIPNGVVDFAVDAQGILHVANPGMHRVERYDASGKLLGRFGRFDGRDPQGFPGCCNPTNLTVDSAGRVVVTEKAGPRAKVYDAAGQLLTVVADDGFDPAATNMDVAVDSTGRIYVADTARLEIRVFQPSPVEVAP
jgi:sugar lactone lactonase YvrE